MLNDIRTVPFEERVAAAEARSEVGELSKTVARLLVRNQEKVNFRSLDKKFTEDFLVVFTFFFFSGFIQNFISCVY